MRKASDFSVLTTGDGSYSLSIANSTGYVEKMHHAAGAMSESLYIYGSAIEMVFEKRWPARILSLGLGLGYNEFLSAAYALKFGASPSTCALYSFETEPVLTESLLKWLNGGVSPFNELYDDIVKRAETAMGISATAIRDWLREANATKSWDIRGAFPDQAGGVERITCVLYDAFSNKMTEELWSEPFLVETMKRMTADNCVFATYAATGALKRALRSLGFQQLEKPGFAGKRESTMAVRE